MASRKPLVLNGGQIQQLQAGDTLAVTDFGGTRNIALTNANAGTLVIGTPVYISGNDAMDKAKADASGTVGAVGLVADATVATTVSGNVAVEGVLVLTTTQWDAAFGTTGGLTAGTLYYLSAATAGVGTSTAPSTVGQYVMRLGRALSTTELQILIGSSILL